MGPMESDSVRWLICWLWWTFYLVIVVRVFNPADCVNITIILRGEGHDETSGRNPWLKLATGGL